MTDEPQRKALDIRPPKRKDDDYSQSARRIVSNYPKLPEREHVEKMVRRHIAQTGLTRVSAKPYASVLKGLCEMVVWQDKEGPVGDRARKSLNAIGKMDWAGMVQNVGKFRSLRTRTGRKASVRAPRAEAMEVGVQGRGCVSRITTEEDLMQVGQALRLCVARADEVGREYRSRLRSGASHFYVVLDATDAPIGLIEEDLSQRTIVQARGAENEPMPAMARALVRELAAQLDVTCGDGDGLPEMGLGYGFLKGPGRVVLRGRVGHGGRFVVWRRGQEVRVQHIEDGQSAFTYLRSDDQYLHDRVPRHTMWAVALGIGKGQDVRPKDREFLESLIA